MRGRGRRLALALLGLLASAALLAPWLPLCDPAAQPDGLVLRSLPPFSRAHALALADGSLRFAHEIRPIAGGGAAYRRGETWRTLDATSLDGTSPGAWHRRPWFIAGTDALGRDMLSRLIHGARISLVIGLVAGAVALSFGTLVGLTAGLSGGLVDGALMRLTDLALAVPRIFLAVLLVALHGPSLGTTILVLGSTTWMPAARLVRGEVLSLRRRDFVQAARAGGVSPLGVAWRHLLPSALGPVIVEGVLRVGDTILLESTLSFLGLGVPPPAASWGNMIADGRASLFDAWWIATLPGIAVAATVLALNAAGDLRAVRLGRPVARATAAPDTAAWQLALRRA